MYNDQNMCMDWDDAIESDGQEYVLLEEGDYNFQVVDFERGRFPGSAKIPPRSYALVGMTQFCFLFDKGGSRPYNSRITKEVCPYGK